MPIGYRIREVKPDALTPRERQIVRLRALGFTVPEIAKQLGIAEKTVMSHTTNMYAKFEFRNTARLVHFALREGIITLEECQ